MNTATFTVICIMSLATGIRVNCRRASRSSLAIALSMLLLVPGIVFVESAQRSHFALASTVGQVAELNPGERWILDRLNAGQIAELRTDSYPLAPDRGIRPEFLEGLLTGTIEIAHRNGIRIRSGTVRSPLGLARVHVIHDVELLDFTFEHDVVLHSSVFDKGLSMAGSTFEGSADLNRVTIGGTVDLHESTFLPAEEAQFSFASINGNFQADGATLPKLGMFGARIDGIALFRNVRFQRPPSFVLSVFNGTLDMTDSTFSADEHASSALFNGASVGETAHFVRAIFESGASFDFLDVKLNLRASQAEFRSKAVFDASRVGGTVFFDNTRFDGLLSLNDMTYGLINAGDSSDSIKNIMDVINHAEFSRQVYSTLENTMLDRGEVSQANSIFVSQRRRERDESLSGIALIGSYLLDFFVLYGLSPQRTLYWSLGIVLIGIALFWRAAWMKGKDKELGYNPIWYSVDLFMPVVNLQMADAWRPNDESTRMAAFRRFWMRIQTLTGWILIPIGLLALTGIFD